MSRKYRKSKDVFNYYTEDEDKFENAYKDVREDFDIDDDEDVEEDEISTVDLNVDDILKLNVDDLEKGRKILSREVITLKNGEERSRAIGDLKEVEAMMFARRRYERKKEQMSEDLQLKQKELDNDLELKREEMERDFEFKQKELEQEREKIEKELELKNKELEQEKIKMEEELALKKEEMAQNLEMHNEEIKVQKRGTIIGAVVNTLLTFASLGAYGYLLDKQNKFESGENYSTSGSRGLTNNISRIPSVFGKH